MVWVEMRARKVPGKRGRGAEESNNDVLVSLLTSSLVTAELLLFGRSVVSVPGWLWWVVANSQPGHYDVIGSLDGRQKVRREAEKSAKQIKRKIIRIK